MKKITAVSAAVTIPFFLLVSACDSGIDTGALSGPKVTLPPDPGAAGRATIQGIDSDNDGVRDDVQIAIYERHPDNETARTVLTQNAIALQEALIAGSTSNTQAIHEASKQVMSAADCLHEHGANIEDSSTEISFMELAVVNTSERGDAYITFNEALDGQFFGATDKPCEQ